MMCSFLDYTKSKEESLFKDVGLQKKKDKPKMEKAHHTTCAESTTDN